MQSSPEQSVGDVSTPDSHRPSAAEVQRLALQTLLSAALLYSGVLLAAYLFRAELLDISRAFVGAWGLWGVMAGFYIPDALTLPLPNDAFSTFGLLGGLSYGEVVAAGSAGSILGGTTGYFLGKFAFGRSPRLRHMLEARGLERVRTDGAWALALGALTPLPYSVFCWSAGAVQMRLSVFLAVSTLRVFRVAGYLWLIQLGVVQVVG